jgi:hypothetical protein
MRKAIVAYPSNADCERSFTKTIDKNDAIYRTYMSKDTEEQFRHNLSMWEVKKRWDMLR